VTRIKNFENFEGTIFLQGSENGCGWIMVISEETGEMAAMVSSDQFDFVVFGATTTL
jgi:hypothetical protein